MSETPKPCNCGAENIGLSDGSSVHGWMCSKCKHTWPRHVTTRGMFKYRQVTSDDPHTYEDPSA